MLAPHGSSQLLPQLAFLSLINLRSTHQKLNRKRSDAVASILRVNRNEARTCPVVCRLMFLIDAFQDGVHSASNSFQFHSGTRLVIKAKGALHGVDGGEAVGFVRMAGWFCDKALCRWKTNLWQRRVLQDEGAVQVGMISIHWFQYFNMNLIIYVYIFHIFQQQYNLKLFESYFDIFCTMNPGLVNVYIVIVTTPAGCLDAFAPAGNRRSKQPITLQQATGQVSVDFKFEFGGTKMKLMMT